MKPSTLLVLILAILVIYNRNSRAAEFTPTSVRVFESVDPLSLSCPSKSECVMYVPLKDGRIEFIRVERDLHETAKSLREPTRIFAVDDPDVTIAATAIAIEMPDRSLAYSKRVRLNGAERAENGATLMVNTKRIGAMANQFKLKSGQP